MDPVTTALVEKLDRELRGQIVRRHESMLRELRYMKDRQDPLLLSVISLGWTDLRLEVLCGLNAFYQLVLGPLASSARERTGVLGPETPILYGETLRFDAERSLRLRSAHRGFLTALADTPDAAALVTAPHFSDLVFRLARSLGVAERG